VSRTESRERDMRKLTNSLVAGQLVSLLLAECVFLLNPEVPHTWAYVSSVWGTFAATYGIVAGLFFWLLLYAIESVRGKSLGPAWLSYRVLTWLVTLALAAAAALLWLNLLSFRQFIPAETLRVIAIAATVVSAAAGVLLVVSLFHYSFGRRGVLASYAVSGAFLVAAIATPLILRPAPTAEAPVPRMPLEQRLASRRLTIIGIEAASMSYVLPAAAEGKLPNFARLIEDGASGAIRTLHPAESLAIWTSIATGKLPRQHGLKAFYRYRFPFVPAHFTLQPRGLDFPALDRIGALNRSAVTASLRRTQPFWSILSRFGIEVGLLRWWGTYPAEEIEGFVVSEYFHRQVREQFEPALPNLTYPPELFARLSPHVVLPEQLDESSLSEFVDTSVVVDDGFPWQGELRRALADDTTYQTIGTRLRDEIDPDVFAIYFFGLDTIGHYFTRYQQPDRFGDVSDAEIRKYGRTVESYYRHLDSILGSYIQSRRANETLIVVSGHGMEPLPITRRIVETFRGNRYLSGFHERSPDGLLILYGDGIAPGTKIQGASVLDVTPTLLYLMGLPLGRDMPGKLRADALQDELVRTQPVTFISSYHNFLIEPRRTGADDWSPLDAIAELEVPE
jgi:predicted AlkP superfamily phosphohydrolase/phosphomutase